MAGAERSVAPETQGYNGYDPRPVGTTPAGRTWSDFAREHPGLVVSGAYFAATLVGMMSSWTLYRRFDINIFHYAQLSDFVLVAVRNPLATVSILLAAPVVWFVMKTDRWLAQRAPWYKYIHGGPRLHALSRTPAAMLLYLVLYAYAFSLLYSGDVEDNVRSGNVAMVEAQLGSGTFFGRDATLPFEAGMLGATSGWVFLYDVEEDVASAIPIENVVSLTPR